jgi:NAD(P)-dependent dehydrogenase (short-subunit alcohol dehydrogenase family)
VSTIIITGASSGIGASAARTLAAEGWDIAVVGRNPERTADVASAVGGRAFLADYDRLDDVRRLADELLDAYPTIDVLANNAGGLSSGRGVTVDGHERILQHNHLAPFLLTNLLLPRLVAGSARVISTASNANRWGRIRLDDLDGARGPWLGGWRQYGTSKIETILFIRELAVRSGLESYSFHPGFVATQFGRGSGLIRFSETLKPGGFGIPVEVGAAPLVHLATTEVIDAPSGTYFDQLTANGPVVKQGHDMELASALWDASAKLVGL